MVWWVGGAVRGAGLGGEVGLIAYVVGPHLEAARRGGVEHVMGDFP